MPQWSYVVVPGTFYNTPKTPYSCGEAFLQCGQCHDGFQMLVCTGTLVGGQLCVKVSRFSRLQVQEKQLGELEGGGMQTPHGILLQARNLLPFLTSASYSSVLPWKSDPKWPHQAAITTCCVISFKVTLVYNLILALHSFGVICVSVFQGSFCPAHASYKNSSLHENVSNEAAPSSRAVPGAARPGWGRNAPGEAQAMGMIFVITGNVC